MTETLFDLYGPRGAIISDDGRYRYRLWRSWNPTRSALTWIMLNPSTADADANDPTIRRCIGFARAWGYGGIVVVNLFAYRATDPANLPAIEAVGPGNNDYILNACPTDGIAIAAWGASVPAYWRHRPPAIANMIRDRRTRLCHLGLTKDGHPRHPLYVPRCTEPTPWTKK